MQAAGVGDVDFDHVKLCGLFARLSYRGSWHLSDRLSSKNTATVTHGRSIIRTSAGNSRKIVICGSRFKDPVFSSVRCPQDDTKNTANHAVVRIGKRNTSQELGCSTLLRHPRITTVCRSKYYSNLTDRCTSIRVGKRDACEIIQGPTCLQNPRVTTISCP